MLSQVKFFAAAAKLKVLGHKHTYAVQFLTRLHQLS